jgi:hypothetical protein
MRIVDLRGAKHPSKYLLASRMRAGDAVTTDVLARAGRYQEVRDNLRIKEIVVGDGERWQRYVVCHNPSEQERQRTHREKLVAQLDVELASLEQRKGKGHSKRACALRASGRFGKYLRETSTGNLRIDRGAIADAERYDGKWVITSNDDTLTAEDLALGYKQLLRVEQCWPSRLVREPRPPLWNTGLVSGLITGGMKIVRAVTGSRITFPLQLAWRHGTVSALLERASYWYSTNHPPHLCTAASTLVLREFVALRHAARHHFPGSSATSRGGTVADDNTPDTDQISPATALPSVRDDPWRLPVTPHEKRHASAFRSQLHVSRDPHAALRHCLRAGVRERVGAPCPSFGA